MPNSNIYKKIWLYVSIMLTIIFTIVFTNCWQPQSIDNPQPSVYFWKTIFKLDSVETKFLENFAIKKIYLRYFDVVIDQKTNQLKPNATIQFKQNIPQGTEIIPVVYIVEKCLRYNIDSVATLLVDRIIKISETNHVGKINQFQIDCDWTAKSENIYFKFLEKIKNYAKTKNLKLSVTIRLHQLNMAVPPCDYGVLMLYNTGSYANRHCKNPILWYNDTKPFIKYLKKYPLKLCAAFPNFKWQILFKKQKFSNILYNENLEDTLNFAAIDSATFVVKKARDIPIYIGDQSFNVMLNYGDTIFVRKAEFNQIKQVKDEIYKVSPQILNQIIIYDLNNNNINNLNYLEYEKIFSGCYVTHHNNKQ